MTELLLQYYRNRFTRYFQNQKLAKLITVFLFLSIFGALSVGIYFFVRGGLLFTVNTPYFKDVLPLFLYEMFLLIIGFLVILSASITALYSLFKRENNEWVIASPRFHTVPTYTAYRVFLSSLWPFVLIALPTLLAMNTVFGIGLWNIIVALVAILFFVAFLVFGTMFTIIIIAYILSKIKISKKSVLSFSRLAATCLILVTLLAAFSWNQALGGDIIALFQADDLTQEIATIGPIAERFKVFPSDPLATLLFQIQTKSNESTLALLGEIVALLIISMLLFTWSKKFYLSLWQKLQENSFVAKSRTTGRVPKSSFIRFFKSPLSAIYTKEWLIMTRNIRNAMWLFFLMMLLFIQTGLNFVMGKNIAVHQLNIELFPSIVQILQYATIAYFISAFVIRFALPSFSTERKTAWILASAPIDIAKMFWSKFWFFNIIFLVLGFATLFVNLFFLHLNIGSAGFLFFLSSISIIFITTLGLSLGAIFPNFNTDDPQVIATSFPGLIFISLSLSYGALGAYLFNVTLIKGVLLPLFSFMVISLLVIAFMLYISPRSLHHTEFVRKFTR
ncbi:hypothetical protein IIC45_00945 [Patescibacteria group bacterium]|nr:hypothetical protein [Patescibacteria group bacterium]